MVGSASGPGSTFKAFLGSARVRVPLSNKSVPFRAPYLRVSSGSGTNFWTREDFYLVV